ncbi:hypothetical protein COCON_G00073220 [Conger conger]|uniref:Senescence domain-containing protein n=1 Tax=Conger conger TaxID=82655 RepID=A0A9Q1I1Y5_CONCO|nr:hypothetical protein COCON_G00073220 [Conger conger]
MSGAHAGIVQQSLPRSLQIQPACASTAPPYGPDAGQATHMAVGCVANVGAAALNFDHLAIRGLTQAARQNVSSTESKPQIKRGKEEEEKREE